MNAGDLEIIEIISSHIEKYIGPIDVVMHEKVSDFMHVDVHVVAPNEKRNFYTCITSGMSDLPMSVPEGLEEISFAELLICLPSDWKLSPEAFLEDENQHYWPLRWLKQLARYPHQAETWLWLDHTIPNGDPPEPLGSNTEKCCIMLGPPIFFPVEFFKLTVNEEKTIHFLMLTPITMKEMEYKLEHGTDDIFDRFLELDPEEMIKLNRPSVC